ncbi:Na+/H+ antiporter subunit E [Allosalinactinospora lopnorensis]|uniref:Na+/H+ antiporter subunit E n=1 Tax=Allosalinactinospora lopnorensis TaxID=1352348 RepID=UPI000623C424|nr:Na+/H+ antiporter subunit E [Allosalinactinospora lopnorensis]
MISRIRQYVSWAGRAVSFAGYFAMELSVACIDVAWDVISPHSRFSPGIVRFPLRCRTEFEMTVMSNVITLTPGTLTLAAESSPPTLYIHCMYARDRHKALEGLRKFETKMLRAVRVDGEVPPVVEAGEHAAPTGGDR